MESKKFRNKKTGEIVTQVPILEMNDYEEIEHSVKKLLSKFETTRNAIKQEVSSSTMDLVDELLEIERELALLEGQ